MARSNTGTKLTRNGVGRPTAITDEVLRKLEEAFAIGASDKEACFYANITPSTLYLYQKDNPSFSERKDALKQRPVLLARQTVMKAMENDPATARWYLERRRKDEFSVKTEVDNTHRMVSPIMNIEENNAVSGNNSDEEG